MILEGIEINENDSDKEDKGNGEEKSDDEETNDDEEKSNGNGKGHFFKKKLIEKIKKKLMKWKGSGKQKRSEPGFIVLPDNTRIEKTP